MKFHTIGRLPKKGNSVISEYISGKEIYHTFINISRHKSDNHQNFHKENDISFEKGTFDSRAFLGFHFLFGGRRNFFL